MNTYEVAGIVAITVIAVLLGAYLGVRAAVKEFAAKSKDG